MIKKDTINEIEIREKIVELALSLQGKQYVHDTYGPDTFDCAGFVKYVYKNVLNINIFEEGIGLSTTTKVMTSKYGILTLYPTIDILNKGDILLFHTQSLDATKPSIDNKYPGHCAIYIGDNKYIHCTSKGINPGVGVRDFSEKKKLNRKLVASKDIVSNFIR